MSIKIYNGFVVNKSFSHALPILREIKQKMFADVVHDRKNATYQLLMEMVADRAMNREFEVWQKTLIPYLPWTMPASEKRAFFEFDPFGENAYSTAEFLVTEWAKHNDIVDTPLNNREEFNFSLKLGLYPKGNRTYGMVFGREEYIAAFLAQPEIKEYSYLENGDRPNGISARSWRQRKAIWETILSENDNGLTYTLFDGKTPGNYSVCKTQFERYISSHFPNFLLQLVKKQLETQLLRSDLQRIKRKPVSAILEASNKAASLIQANAPSAMACMQELIEKLPSSPKQWSAFLNEGMGNQTGKEEIAR